MPELIQTVERAAFEAAESLEVGMEFEAEAQDGSVHHIVVTEVEGDDITIDANHPLAGMALHFDVEILGVREATDEEASHGHAH